MTPIGGVLVGTLFVILGLPLWFEYVPQNELYGLRTEATLNNEIVWREANKRSGRDFVLGGLLLVAAAAWFAYDSTLSEASERRDLNVLGLVIVLAVAVKGVFVANRLAKRRRQLPTIRE